MKIALFFLIAFFDFEVSATVRILTFHYNQADFIELQYKMLRKFLSDDFEMIVFNDAVTSRNEEWIKDVCDEYGIRCIRFQPEWHFTDPLNIYLKDRLQSPSDMPLWEWTSLTPLEEIAQHPSIRHCHVIQYALDHFGYDHDDLVVVMDGDNFLIQPMSFKELLGSDDLVWCSRQSEHLEKFKRQLPKEVRPWDAWVVFVAFNPSKLPTPHELKFHVDIVRDHPNLLDNITLDSGGAVYKYTNKYPDLKIKEFYWQNAEAFRSSFSRKKIGENCFYYYLMKFIEDIDPENVQLLASEHFLHFGSVSFQSPGHSKKAYFFSQFIYNLLEIKNVLVDRKFNSTYLYSGLVAGSHSSSSENTP